MGVVFFSSQVLSLFGRIPFKLNDNIMFGIIAAGYIFSMLFMAVIPRKIIIVQRITLIIAFFTTFFALFPFGNEVVSLMFYITSFCCVFSIGTMSSEATLLFSLDTAWRDGIIGIAIGGIGIAFLQNEIIKINFSIFMIFSLIFIALLLYFHFKLPSKILVEFTSKKTNFKKPKIQLFGIFLLIILSTAFLLMATSIAETVQQGVSVMYGSASILAIVLFVFRKKNNSDRIFSVYIMLTPMGFVCSIISTKITEFGLIACIFFGFSVVLSCLYLFFLVTAFSFYPSRYIAVQGTFIGFILALIHSFGIEMFRNNLTFLYDIYLILSFGLMLGYYFAEPFFLYNLKNINNKNVEKKDIGDSIKEIEISDKVLEKEEKVLRTLSLQEQNLVKLILQGYSETEIAKEMNIKLNTQKSYRKNVYSKLGIHSKRELFLLMRD